MDPKRYTDEEMTAILRRASALQAVDTDPRHSLAEIAEIAAQVGIPTALIQQAASEMDQSPPRTPAAAYLLGPRPQVVAGGVVPGQWSQDAMSELIPALRQVTGREGRTADLRRGVEWRDPSELQTLTVTVTPGNDGTSVRVVVDHTTLKSMLYGVTGTFAGLGAFFGSLASIGSGSPAVTLAVSLTASLGLLGGARLLWSWLHHRARRRAERIRDLLLDRIRALPSSPANPSPSGP